jgi:histidinol dehydrogenase
MTGTIVQTRWRYRGVLSALSTSELASLLRRGGSTSPLVRQRTEEIVQRVQRDGDDALRELAREYDGVSLESLEVPRAALRSALDKLEPALRSALERAARNIEAVHAAAPPRTVEVETEPGVIVGRRPDPLQRVGIYAPGGRAAYASSVLMAGIPARVAGVSEIILCSPPQRDGYPAEVVLAACAIAGVDRVFSLGGAGAIAAMAYGTESVPRVDRIVGPGNAFVAEAKLQVSRDVGIDSPAGPSELFVICDADCDPQTIAREVLAQAEHDANACVVVVCLDDTTASSIEDAVDSILPDAPRSDIIRGALEQNGALLIATSISNAIDFANTFAPEHLLLAVTDREAGDGKRGAESGQPVAGNGQRATDYGLRVTGNGKRVLEADSDYLDDVLSRVRNAGCVFVGEQSSVVFGDYITGSNHILPTGGLARSFSGLGPLDFVRWTSYQKVSCVAAHRLADDTALLAGAEGLPAHADAALKWSVQR